MANMTATFAADYTEFNAETQKASSNLLKFEGQSRRTAGALDVMARGMSDIGASRMESIQASTRMIEGMGAAGAKAAPEVTKLSQSIHAFDGVLSAAGIHIGPELRGLEDLGNAAGKGSEKLDGFAKAGLVVGTALAAWKVGRVAAEFFDLDKKIGDATAKLLGWGDAVGEAAGAKQDVLDRATAKAGRTITEYGEAIKIVNQAWKDDAPDRYLHSLESIEAATAALTEEDKAHIETALKWNESASEIAKGLKINEGAVKAYTEALTAADQAQKKSADDAAKAAKQWTEAWTELSGAGLTWQQELNSLSGDTVQAIKFYNEAGVSNQALGVIYGETAEKIGQVVTALGKENAALEAATKARDAKRAADKKAEDDRNTAIDTETDRILAARQAEHDAFMELDSHVNRGDESFTSTFDTVEQVQAALARGQLDAATAQQLINNLTAKGATTPPATITPAPTGPGGGRGPGGAPIDVHVTVNVTAKEIAQQVEQELLKNAKFRGLIGA